MCWLKKSMILLGTLDSRGCMYFVKGTVLTVVKGNKIVIKSQKVWNLYKWIGSTVKVELGDSNSQVVRLAIYLAWIELLGIREHASRLGEAGKLPRRGGCLRRLFGTLLVKLVREYGEHNISPKWKLLDLDNGSEEEGRAAWEKCSQALGHCLYSEHPSAGLFD